MNDLAPESKLGSIKRITVATIAAKAARRIARAGGALMAVTLTPEGVAFLEPPAEVAEVDLVGTYRGTQPFAMERAIYADLQHEIALRGGYKTLRVKGFA